MSNNRFWYGISWTKIWFCFIIFGFSFGFIWSDYSKDELSMTYWKGIMINWGWKMKEGDAFPYGFECVSDKITMLELIQNEF